MPQARDVGAPVEDYNRFVRTLSKLSVFSQLLSDLFRTSPELAEKEKSFRTEQDERDIRAIQDTIVVNDFLYTIFDLPLLLRTAPQKIFRSSG